MMKSVRPLFFYFCVKDKEALVLEMGVKRARKEVKKPDKRKHLHLQSRFTRSLPKYGVDGCPHRNVVPT